MWDGDWTETSRNQGKMRITSKQQKRGKNKDLPLEISKRSRPLLHLDFILVTSEPSWKKNLCGIYSNTYVLRYFVV